MEHTMSIANPRDLVLRAALDPLRPLFDRALEDDQDRLLDLTLTILGHELDWEEWLDYAREYLPHYRSSDRVVAIDWADMPTPTT